MNFYVECRELLKTEHQLNRLMLNEEVIRREIKSTQDAIQDMAATNQYEKLQEATRILKSWNNKLDKNLERQANIATEVADRLSSISHMGKEVLKDPQTWLNNLQRPTQPEAPQLAEESQPEVTEATA